jgi:hypothetical protein
VGTRFPPGGGRFRAAVRYESVVMAYSTAEARQELLDTLAEAADALGYALSCLGEAYDRLDEHNGDRLEEELFRPVQAAYGRAKQTHSEFAARHGLPGREFAQQPAGVSSPGAAGFVSQAVDAVAEADAGLAELQDSMLPVEAGDPELRAGLQAVRDRIGGLPARARGWLRTLGR